MFWQRIVFGFVLFTCAALALPVQAANVREFGAVGDGQTDDTSAIRDAIRQTETGLVIFPRGDYRITETIEIDLAETDRIGLDGRGGAGRVIMEGTGPALRFVGHHRGTANPASVEDATWQRQRMPQVQNLEILGRHPEADGLAFAGTMQATVRGILIREVRHGIRLTGRNRNVLIDAVHIYDCTGVGVFFDQVNLHQANVTGSHISYCDGGGIKVEASEIRNLQITGNDIEYNYDQDAEESADIWIDARRDTVREGTIASNTIQAVPSPNGANIRFVGPEPPESRGATGMWTISGNLIGNQEVNIHLKNAEGITVTGNHIYTARQQTILVENSRNIVVSSNVMEQSHGFGRDFRNGITLRQTRGIVLTGNVITDAAIGSEQAGGAVELFDCQETILANNQIFEPRYRGIYVQGGRNALITANQVMDRSAEPGMLAAIEIRDDARGAVLRGNVIGPGREGDILAHEGVSISETATAVLD